MSDYSGLEEIEIARLPFSAAQGILGLTAPVGQRLTTTVGWHGTRLDPERGSCAIVRSGGPLDEYLGERLRLFYASSGSRRSVVVFVHSRSDDVLDDLSLTRRSFLALAPLNQVPITVALEVLS